MSLAVSAAEITRLRADVEAMPWPARVAILSGPPGDFELRGPSLSAVPELIAGALDRRGLYVVADASDAYGGGVHVTVLGTRLALAPYEVQSAVLRDVPPTRRIVERVRYALSVAATGLRPLEGAVEIERERGYAAGDDRDPVSAEDAVAFVALGGGGLAGFAIPAALWWRRDRRSKLARSQRLDRRAKHARRRGRPPAPRVPLVREPEADVADKANGAVQRLAEAIAAADQPADAAFDLYSAAVKAVRDASNPIDSVGALVLAQDARAVLAGRERRRRCFFDPDHRGPTEPTRWRIGSDEAEVPACTNCERALRDGRHPAVLADRGRPYFERDTVWARTGFGAIDDELAAKVLSGR